MSSDCESSYDAIRIYERVTICAHSIVFEATPKVINCYMLSRLTSKATRRLYRSNTRFRIRRMTFLFASGGQKTSQDRCIPFSICELLLIILSQLRYLSVRRGQALAMECPIRRCRLWRYCFVCWGKCANIFCTPLSRLLVFLSALLESVSLDESRQIKFLVLASNGLTTRSPTL